MCTDRWAWRMRNPRPRAAEVHDARTPTVEDLRRLLLVGIVATSAGLKADGVDATVDLVVAKDIVDLLGDVLVL